MAIETLRPNAAGSECNISNEAGEACPNHYLNVDEATPDNWTTTVTSYPDAAKNTWYRDLYGLADSGGSGTINKVTIKALCRSHVKVGSVEGKIRTALRTHDTSYDGTEHAVVTSWQLFEEEYTVNPFTGSAWTWAEIDALEIGISLYWGYVSSSDSNAPCCTQLYVEVDYTPDATEKESSDTGSGADASVALETQQDKESADSGFGVDVVELLDTPDAKTSSDTGSGAEGTPVASAVLEDSQSGYGIEALIARLLADGENGESIEASSLATEELKDLSRRELGEGLDRLVAKIETPTKGGGLKL